MIRITFLIGNGFDLAQGLDTSYQAFCKWYCEKYPTEKEVIKIFKNDISKDYKHWADFETALGEYSEEFSKTTVEEYMECADDTRIALNTYLEQIEKNYQHADYSTQLSKISKRLFLFYSGLNPEETNIVRTLVQPDCVVVNFASFNYTTVLDKLVGELYADSVGSWRYYGNMMNMTVEKNVLHVHGKKGLFPILGLDNEEQITNKELIECSSLLKKTMIKRNTIKAAGYDWDKQLIDLINGSNVICIYGMSLGKTDKRWWDNILKWLVSIPKRRLIIYYYTDNPPKKIVVSDILIQTEKVKSLLRQYDDNNYWDSIEDRIHVIFNSPIFNFSQ